MRCWRGTLQKFLLREQPKGTTDWFQRFDIKHQGKVFPGLLEEKRGILKHYSAAVLRWPRRGGAVTKSSLVKEPWQEIITSSRPSCRRTGLVFWWSGMCPVSSARGTCGQRGVRTAVPQDVNFGGDAVSPGPRHPDLHEGVSEIFRDRDVDPALAGQVQRGSGVGILPVEHLLGEAALSLCVHHDSLGATCKRPAACCSTLYPVTADSSVCATTGSHLMLTVDPEKVQEMLPGGLLGAKRHKRRQIQPGGGRGGACAACRNLLGL